MRYRLLSALAILLIFVTVSAVFAAKYAPAPTIVTTTGAPALIGNQIAGVFTLLYPDGSPASVMETTVTLRVCGTTGCADVLATITSTASGTYTYSFTLPPTITGTVTITLPANSLSDANGTTFPRNDVELGTYTT